MPYPPPHAADVRERLGDDLADRIERLNARQMTGLTHQSVMPGYAPDLNPDELVWSHVKRTGVARNPLRAGEKLDLRIEQQLHDVQRNRRLVRSFFGTPSVANISDC
jgi:hypothetical protein